MDLTSVVLDNIRDDTRFQAMETALQPALQLD
jgi:hypothetical protein